MSAMKEFLSNSYLFGANAPFIEELYEAYLDDPQAVPEQWREYFDKLQRLPAGPEAGRGVNSWCVERVDSFTIAAWSRRRATFACLDTFSWRPSL